MGQTTPLFSQWRSVSLLFIVTKLFKMKLTTVIIIAVFICLSANFGSTAVYIFEEQDGSGHPTGFYKIGVSVNLPYQRLQAAQTADPRPLVEKKAFEGSPISESVLKQILNSDESGDWVHNPLGGGGEWYHVLDYNHFENEVENMVFDAENPEFVPDDDDDDDVVSKNTLLQAIAQLYALIT